MAASPRVKLFAVSTLKPRPNNPRTHSDAQVAQIVRSMEEFGFTNPLLIEADGTVIAGHGRLRAAVQLEMEKVPCIVLSELTPDQIRALVIADNQLALNAGWDDDLLQRELQHLAQAQYDLSVLGFNDPQLAEILADTTDPDRDSPEDDERARMLARANITIDDPEADVQAGDAWYLGRHVLVVADVLRQHERWRHLLVDDVLFAPFAGPFAIATEVAVSGRRIVIVQPDTYIAGHIIDRFAEWYPSEVVRVQREGDPTPDGVLP